MPIYEYRCDECANRFELRRSFNDDDGPSCPKCKGSAHRVFCPVPIIFRGSGFYITDSRGKDVESAS